MRPAHAGGGVARRAVPPQSPSGTDRPRSSLVFPGWLEYAFRGDSSPASRRGEAASAAIDQTEDTVRTSAISWQGGSPHGLDRRACGGGLVVPSRSGARNPAYPPTGRPRCGADAAPAERPSTAARDPSHGPPPPPPPC